MYPTVIPVNRNDRPQDIINKILLSTRYSGITSERSDPFAEGWNAAMKFQKMRELDLCKPLPMPVNVIFSNPATIVFWSDGDKTVVKCQPGDTFCAETGLSMAMLKKYMGNDNTFNKVIGDWLERAHYTGDSALPEAAE